MSNRLVSPSIRITTSLIYPPAINSLGVFPEIAPRIRAQRHDRPPRSHL
jgi:hypothetical protein